MNDPTTFSIGNHPIGPGHPALVIAEIGINHEGSLANCLDLITAASESKADAVKLQTSDPDENYVPGTASYELFRKAFLGPEETKAAFRHARQLGIEIFTTTGVSTFSWIEELSPVAYKISSSTLGHYPLLRKVASAGRPLILSTGMAEEHDITDAVAWARACGAAKLALLQCTSLYPCPPELLDLAAISDLASRYNCPVGFSDHSLGIDAAPISIAAGACIIEKHFSLDPGQPSFDHHISLSPRQFRSMVERIRATETMLGSPVKRLTPLAKEVANRMRRAIVARRRLEGGRVLQEADIAIMRHDGMISGIPPSEFDRLIGATLTRDVEQWAPIPSDVVEF